MKTIRQLLVVGCLLGLVTAYAEEPKENAKSTHAATAEQHVAMNAGDLQWMDAPPALPPGAKLAVLQGDPGKSGPFTIRLQVPSGYKIPPHTHPTTENITVISGTMSFGMGPRFDKSAGKQIEAGGFASMPSGMPHYAWSTGETVLQVHAKGPFKITYVNPADDPRSAKK